jgi:hypothetical protein
LMKFSDRGIDSQRQTPEVGGRCERGDEREA